MRDIKEFGYGKMTVNNYKKNGDVFNVDIVVYPIFDSPSNTGKDADLPVLTHFASIMTPIPMDNVMQQTQSRETMTSSNVSREDLNSKSEVDSGNEENIGSSDVCKCPKTTTTKTEALTTRKTKRFDAKCVLSSEVRIHT